MGSALSHMDCGLLDLLAGTHPDVEISAAGIVATEEAMLRIQKEREKDIVKDIQSRAADCVDLEADVKDLERQAIDANRLRKKYKLGSRQFNLHKDTGRRALAAAELKRAEIAKHRKVIEMHETGIQTMKAVAENGDRDRNSMALLREYSEAHNVNKHAEGLEEIEIDATEATDNLAEMAELQQKFQSAIAKIETPSEHLSITLGDDTFQLGDDDDLLKALDRLEEEQMPLAADDESTADPAAVYDMPEAPNVEVIDTRAGQKKKSSNNATNNKPRHVAMAMGADGSIAAQTVSKRPQHVTAPPIPATRDYFAEIY